jgi:metallopeptidase MepB
MPGQKAPQEPLQFATLASSITDTTQHHIDELRLATNTILEAVTPETATFANVLLPLAHAHNTFRSGTQIIWHYEDTSPNPELRSASRKASNLLVQFDFENGSRKDMFTLVDAAAKKKEHLDPECKLFLETQLRSYQLSGLHLPEAQRLRLKEIHQRKIQLHEQFWDVPKNAEKYLYFRLEELDGVPADVISKLEKGHREKDSMMKVSFEYSVNCGVMEYASRGETRKRYSDNYPQMPHKKEEILREIVLLRDEAARLLGYPNHAALMIEERVAESPDAVNKFLGDLRGGLVAGGVKELQALKLLKKADIEARGEAFDGKLYRWDQRYYERIMLEMQHSVDDEMVSEYFPLHETARGMLHIFETIFCLVFEKIEQASVWQGDVQLFSVWDSGDLGGEFLGYLYLDLYKRENKYDGVCNSNLQPVGISYSVSDKADLFRDSRAPMEQETILALHSSATSKRPQDRNLVF